MPELTMEQTTEQTVGETLEDFDFSNICFDHYWVEGKECHEFYLYLTLKEDHHKLILGKLLYTVLPDKKAIHIDYVEIIEGFRGMGFAKALYMKLHELNKSLTFGDEEFTYMEPAYYNISSKRLRKWFKKDVLKMKVWEDVEPPNNNKGGGRGIRQWFKLEISKFINRGLQKNEL